MLNPSTGMKPGERYAVDSLENPHHFPGFFLDGKYYLHPELLTAVGWVEGQQFIYDELDASGQPVYPDGVAGTVEDLTLKLIDGTALRLIQIEFAADPIGFSDDIYDQKDERAPSPEPSRVSTPALIAATVASLLLGYGLNRLFRKDE